MTRIALRVRQLGLALALAALLLASTPPARAEDEAVAPWHDAAMVEAAFTEACDAVEKVRGTPFGKRPTVRLTTRDELREILGRELRPVFVAGGLEGAMEGTLATMSRALLAKYEIATHTVHLIPERLDDTKNAYLPDGSPDLDFLRVLLAHEACHAHDWPRYGWNHEETIRKGQDALAALNAIVEGHAQYVAKRAADRLGIPDAFDRVTEAIVSVPPIEQEALRPLVETYVATLAFAYVQGQAFVEAIAAARGPEGLEAALQKPPTTTRAIEFPAEWLAPQERGETPDLERAVEAFRPLVGDDAWTVRTTRLLKAQLAPVSRSLPEAYREPFVQGVLDGHVLAGLMPTEDRSVMGLLLWFRSPEGATTFLEGDRKAQEAKDAAGGVPGLAQIESSHYDDGGGRDGSLPGYVSTKVVRVGTKRIEVMTHTVALGPLVAQLLVVNSPEIDRDAQDAAMERLARYVGAPAEAEASGVFDAPAVALERNTRRLVIRVRGPDGEPVHRARVSAHAGTRLARDEVRNGEAALDAPKDTVTVRVWMAQGQDGEPLNLAPRIIENVLTDQETLDVELAPGAVLSGRVVDDDGHPVANVKIAARPPSEDEGPGSPGTTVHAVATSDADGGFRLVGLAPGRQYEVEVEPGEDQVAADPVQALAGATDVRIALPAGMRVAVTVLDGEGAPVAGAHLEVTEHRERGASVRSWTSATDARGRAERPALIQDAAYDLAIRPPAARRDLARYRDIAWHPSAEPISLPPGFTVRGVVKDEEGEPVRALVATQGRELAFGTTRWTDNDTTRSDAQGRFEIHNLPAGEVRLCALPADEPPWLREEATDFVAVTPEHPEVECPACSDGIHSDCETGVTERCLYCNGTGKVGR